jgi:hypothetical protein
MDKREREKQKKMNTKDPKIWISQLQDRYGYPQLTTMLVPNPNWSGRKNKRKRREVD